MHLKAARPAPSRWIVRLPNVVAVVVAVVAVVLAGGHSHADQRNAAAQPASYAFDRHEIDIGPAVRQTVLTGFLLGGEMADLAVIKVEEDGVLRLRIYAFELGPDEDVPGKAEAHTSPPAKGTWALRMDTRLRAGVTFVDVARIDGRDRLITGEPGRLTVWDPGSDTENELVSVSNTTSITTVTPAATGFRAPRMKVRCRTWTSPGT